MNLKTKLTRKKFACFCFFGVLTVVLVYKMIAFHSTVQPPYIYKAVTSGAGSYYEASTNTSHSLGANNWAVEYVLDRHDGSEIEAWNTSYDERQPYAEKNDIGTMRLQMVGDCPYVNDIERISYSVDWGMADAFYSGGYLDLDSGLICWEDGAQVIDGYGYRNDIKQHRAVDCELNFYLKDGRFIREYAYLHLEKQSILKLSGGIS